MNRTVDDFVVDKCLSESKSKIKTDFERSLRGLNFGKLYLKNGEFETAIKYVNAYLGVRPNSSEGHKLLAQIYEAMGDNDRALNHYRKSLDIKKGSIENNLSFTLTNNDSISSIINTTISSPMLNNSKSIENNSNSSVKTSEPKETKGKNNPNNTQSETHSCGTCSNQSVLYKMAKQQENLLETNKVILDLLKQNNSNINNIQQQLVGIYETLNNLTDSQNVLKDTIYEYMTQEEHEDFDDYIEDKENEVLDSSSILTPNNSNSHSTQWHSSALEMDSTLDQIKPLSELFKPALNSWQCEACYVQNNASETTCAACTTPKPGTEVPNQTNETFKLSNVEPFSFKPSLTSSTTGFKFGSITSNSNLESNCLTNSTPGFKFGSGNSNSNLESNSIFSNTNFKFGNTPSPQSFPAFGSSPQLALQSNKLIDDKESENIFAIKPNESKTVSFQFGSIKSFDFEFPKTQTEKLLTPPKPVPEEPLHQNETEERNRSFSDSQVEPSDADNIYFQPIVPLPPKIEVKTGEEEESVLYVCRARLFRFCDNEWKERGVGELKILKSRDSNRIRMLMRRDTIFKVCLNQYITTELKLDLKDDKKSMTWSAIDYSEDTPNPQIFLLRLKNAENTELFMNAFKNAQTLLETIDSSQTDSKPIVEIAVNQNDSNSNKSKVETIDNKIINFNPESIRSETNEDKDLEIVFVKMPENEETLRKVKELKLPLNFFDYEDMEPCKGCRGCRDEEIPINSSIKSIHNENPINEISDSTQESLFSSLIAATNVSPSDWKTNSSQKLWTNNTPTPLFSSDRNTAEEEDVIANPDIYFKPLIPLPDLVEVKTGEEEEEVIYCQRAKIYRYHSDLSEWKERGIGDFKILKHNSKNRYRMILRRDQILKIACNHYITSDMSLNPMNTSETAICWYAIDYSEGNPTKEQFALKLKNKDLLKEFIKIFNECKNNLGNNENNTSDQSEDTDAEEDQQN